MEYYAVSTSNTLQHHGVLGQKWGVRRFQNADGSLTAAGKQKLAKYKEKELKRTEKFYNQNVRGGLYGYKLNRQGFNSLNKEKAKLESKYENAKLKSNSEKMNKYQNDLKINAGKQKALEILKKNEMQIVKNMTFDQMHAEKVNLGKKVAGAVLRSAAISTMLANPMMGVHATYLEIPNAGQIKSQFRANGFKTPVKTKVGKTNEQIKNQEKKYFDASERFNNSKPKLIDPDWEVMSSSSKKLDKLDARQNKQIKSAVETARKTGKMDIDFVEKIQNNERLMNARNDDPKLLSEYEKYLRNK